MSRRTLSICACKRLGIAGAVREKDAIGLQREHVFGGGERRDDGHVAAGMHEAAQDVLFDAEIVGDDVIARLGRGARAVRKASRARRDSVQSIAFRRATRGWRDRARPWRESSGLFRPASARLFRWRRERRASRRGCADGARARAYRDRRRRGCRTCARNCAGFLIRAPVAGDAGKFADDETFDVRLARLRYRRSWCRNCRFAGW